MQTLQPIAHEEAQQGVRDEHQEHSVGDGSHSKEMSESNQDSLDEDKGIHPELIEGEILTRQEQGPRKMSLVTFDPNQFEGEGFSGSRPATEHQLSDEALQPPEKTRSRLSRFHSMDLKEPQSEMDHEKQKTESGNLKTQTTQNKIQEEMHFVEEVSVEPLGASSSARNYIVPQITVHTALPQQAQGDSLIPTHVVGSGSQMSMLDLLTPKCGGVLVNTLRQPSSILQEIGKNSPVAERTPTWGVMEPTDLLPNVAEQKKLGGFLARVDSLQEPHDIGASGPQTEFVTQTADKIILAWPQSKKPTMDSLKNLDSPIHQDKSLLRPDRVQFRNRTASTGMFIISEQADHHPDGVAEGLFGSPAHMYQRPRLPTSHLEEVDQQESENTAENQQPKGCPTRELSRKLAKKSTLATCWTPSSDQANTGYIPKLASCTSGGSQLFQIETPTADSILPVPDGKSMFQRLCSKESAFTDIQAQKRPIKKQKLLTAKLLDPNSPHHQSCGDPEVISVPVVQSKFSKFTTKASKESVVSPSPQVSPCMQKAKPVGSLETRDRLLLRTQQLRDRLEDVVQVEKIATRENENASSQKAPPASPHKDLVQQLKEAKNVIILALVATILILFELLGK